MEECLICKEKFDNKRQLSNHLHARHKMLIRQYKEKFNLIQRCKVCNKELIKGNKTGYCSIHRDRTGKNNSFYGKTHNKQTVDKIKEKTRETSKKLWEDPEYRKKVIDGTSKPRSEEGKQNISNAVKGWYDDNPNQKELRSNMMKQRWEDGEVPSSNFSCNKSKLEIELFSEIKKIYTTAESNKTLHDKDNKYYFPDIILDDYNIIIEFYGNYWHANPKMYNKDSIIKHRTAKEIWENDKRRINKLENNMNKKYKVIIIWQKDYQDNKEKVLKDLTNQIENYIKENKNNV